MNYYLSSYEIEKIRKFSKNFYPFETCGIIGCSKINNKYFIVPLFLENKASNKRMNFRIKNEDLINGKNILYENCLKFCGFFHSHPSTFARPTQGDKNFHIGNSLWLIYSVCHNEIKLYQWNGFKFNERIILIS